MAAAQPPGTAELATAQAYLFGDGVAANPDSADAYLRKAALLGHPDANYLLGLNFLRGLGATADLDSARFFLHRAAEANQRDALALLFKSYAEGTSPLAPVAWPKDSARAYRYAERLGSRWEALIFRARVLHRGSGLPRNDTLAVALLDSAAFVLQNPDAQLLRGDWALHATTTLGQDLPTALRAYTAAAGNARSTLEQTLAGRVGSHEVARRRRRAFNLLLLLGILDPETAPQLNVRE